MLLSGPDIEKWFHFRRSDTWKKWHRVRCLCVLFLTLVAVVCYITEWIWRAFLPGGSSAVGLVCGTLAALLFVYLFLYCCRKVRGVRWLFNRHPTAFYLARHIWLGLLTFPLVALHTGCLTRWGGLLPSLVLFVYLGVFISGIWGLWLQQRFPRRLLYEVPDETIRAQIPDLLKRLRREAVMLVRAACGPSPDPAAVDPLNEETVKEWVTPARRHRGVGLLQPIKPTVATEKDIDRLWRFLNEQIEPYLRPNPPANARLRLYGQSTSDFVELRGKLSPGLGEVVDMLEKVCDHRRRLDEQTRLHDFLHGWISIHLVLSAVLLVLVFGHALTALVYW